MQLASPGLLDGRSIGDVTRQRRDNGGDAAATWAGRFPTIENGGFFHGKMVMFPEKSGFDQEDGRFFLMKIMKQVVIEPRVL